MNFRYAITWAVSLLIFGSTSLTADSYRCGRKLISTGDSSAELLRTCGEPVHRDRGKVRLSVDGVDRTVSAERWYYKRSNRSLEHIIVVYRGVVQDVIVGNR